MKNRIEYILKMKTTLKFIELSIYESYFGDKVLLLVLSKYTC